MNYSQTFQIKRYIFVILIRFPAVAWIQGCFYWLSNPVCSGVMVDQRFVGAGVSQYVKFLRLHLLALSRDLDPCCVLCSLDRNFPLCLKRSLHRQRNSSFTHKHAGSITWIAFKCDLRKICWSAISFEKGSEQSKTRTPLPSWQFIRLHTKRARFALIVIQGTGRNMSVNSFG